MSRFNKQDVSILRDYFISNPTWHTLSKDELKDAFSDYLVDQTLVYRRALNDYQTIINTANTQLSLLPISVVGLNKAQISERAAQRQYYLNERERAETSLSRLDEEVKQLAESNANWATELKAIQSGVNELTGLYGVNIDDTKNAAFSAARGMRRKDFSRAEKDIANTDYGNDPDVQNEVTRLNTILNTGDLEDVYNNMVRIKPIIDNLKTKRENYLNNAKQELNTGFTDYETKHKAVEDEFKASYKELTAYINAPTVDLDKSFKDLFGLMGEEILKNDAAVDNEVEFTTIVNAYINDYLQKRHAATPNYLMHKTGQILVDFMNAATIGNLDGKKAALDNAKSFKKELDKAQKTSTKSAKKDIKNWYHYVTLDSVQYDNPDNHTGEFKWSMFDEKGNIVDDHGIGIYASAGLGFFQNLSDSAYIRYLTDGAYESIKELETGIVKKHKSLKAIGVNEALLWGLSHAITKSHKKNITHEIEEKCDAILDLDDTSSLFEIRTAYNNAANLGKELNHDAIQWTYRSSVGYDKLDNQLNRELCGWNYKLIDTGRDWLKKLSIFTKKETPNLGRSRTEGYDVDLTAFEPIKNPTLKSLGVLLGGTAVAYEAIEHIGKALSEKGGIGEIFKEILLFGGLTAGEKLLTKGSTPVAAPSAATTH